MDKPLLTPERILEIDEELVEAIADGKLAYLFVKSYMAAFMRKYAKETVHFTLQQVSLLQGSKYAAGETGYLKREDLEILQEDITKSLHL